VAGADAVPAEAAPGAEAARRVDGSVLVFVGAEVSGVEAGGTEAGVMVVAAAGDGSTGADAGAEGAV
jgi:hypothetical protein